ncbi:hypothetical protein PoB_007645200 [Plakobranchus ocellatus]|uniref:DUF229 domain containing protein n=1 Tax=Plakobranchus ocellatus TaxID=259542 RepID=A0AAV4E047_9GAST|nr:hypothetical protein PoB_007645200 [Plakobranchus ocellatus]
MFYQVEPPTSELTPKALSDASKDVCVLPRLYPCEPQILPFDHRARRRNTGEYSVNMRPLYEAGETTQQSTPLTSNLCWMVPLCKQISLRKVACLSSSELRYFNIHKGVARNATLMERARTKPLPDKALGGYDMFIFGFDSVSRMSWLRNLPKTGEYFVRGLAGIEIEDLNIVGDGTAQMRLNEFQQQPTDHYMRTYVLSAEPMYRRFRTGCVGSEFRHVRFFNYRDLYHMYGTRRMFMFGFHSECSHNDNNGLKMVDIDFVQFLQNLSSSGYLNNTILILMADHGSRFSDIRLTQQGKLEERLPYFGFSFPPSFQAAYPEKVVQLRKNRQRLTTKL